MKNLNFEQNRSLSIQLEGLMHRENCALYVLISHLQLNIVFFFTALFLLGVVSVYRASGRLVADIARLFDT